MRGSTVALGRRFLQYEYTLRVIPADLERADEFQAHEDRKTLGTSASNPASELRQSRISCTGFRKVMTYKWVMH